MSSSSLFFDYKLQDVPANTETSCFGWSRVDDILAVGYKDNTIYFYKDEGQQIPGLSFSRNSPPCVIEWQPRGRLVAVGWEDGTVTVCNIAEKVSREGKKVHGGMIVNIAWAPGGNRFISSDQNGVTAVWKTDMRGNISLSCQYRRQGSITHCVFVLTKQQREKMNTAFAATICPNFIFGGEMGTVHYADDLGHITDVHFLQSAIESMLFYEEKSRLVIITRSLLMVQLQVGDDGKVTVVQKVKLSIAGDGIRQVIWAGPGLLATNSGEQMIRFWDVSRDENYVLSLASIGDTVNRMDKLSSVDFDPSKRILAAGTRDGKVLLWRYIADDHANIARQSDDWEPLVPLEMKDRVLSVKWCVSRGTLAVRTTSFIKVLVENILQLKMIGEMAAIQTDPRHLSIARFNHTNPADCTELSIASGIDIKGFSLDANKLVVWNGREALVHDLDDDNKSSTSSFKCASLCVVMKGDTLYRSADLKIEACNLSGVVKDSYNLQESMGTPILMDISSRYLAIVTNLNYIRVFDIGKRDFKSIGSARKFEDPANPGVQIGAVRLMKVNADGTKLGIISDRVDNSLGARQPDSKVYVFCLDSEKLYSYEFGPKRYPISIFWEPQDPKFFAVETVKRRVAQGESQQTKKKDQTRRTSIGEINIPVEPASPRDSPARTEVTTMFATEEHGILMQDCFEEDEGVEALLGLRTPYICFSSKRAKIKENNTALLKLRVMRDFVGLTKTDDKTKAALMDFSYHLTTGNMDEAYRSVRLIQNPSVWENMAHMCVKTKRLDVAMVCLANMGHARGAAAVREARKEPELEAAVAMVAIQLGLLDDAIRLYKECGRWDLLNELYQATGRWDKAINLAADKDRIHLKNTHFKYAKYLETIGEIVQATKHYEMSETHVKQATRMLFENRRVGDLESYVSQCRDKELVKWWAQYCESKGRLEKAKQNYREAGDDLSIVRLLCLQKDFDGAIDYVQQRPKPGSYYFLARQLELNGDVERAIQFFAKAKRYNHAARLAKEHNMLSELMSFAVMGTPALKLDCAEYFEQLEDYEKAVQLYHKGGNIPKALDLCFKATLYDLLQSVTDDLREDTSPLVLVQCAEFFMDHGKFEKALQMFVAAKRYNDALDLAMTQKIIITEETADKFVPETKVDSAVEQKARQLLLIKLAKVCKRQGSYQLAAKKYTQAGEKLKAMKSLVKAGDTEKITLFANVSRTREVYILAANYLQNLDWPNDAKIMQTIITFYSKAKAFEQLSGFYDACALVEIDEFRNYEKALSALKEAAKALGKSDTVKSNPDSLGVMRERIELLERFVEARATMKENPEEGKLLIQNLIQEPKAEIAIRVGDAFSMLVDHSYRRGDTKEAYELIEQMQSRRILLNRYLDQSMVNDIFRKNGIDLEDTSPRRGRISTLESKAQDKQQGGSESSDSKGGGFTTAKSTSKNDDGEAEQSTFKEEEVQEEFVEEEVEEAPDDEPKFPTRGKK